MIALVQRVTQAAVSIDGTCTAAIGKGLVILLGVERQDQEAQALKLAQKIARYRLFADAQGKMNLNILQVAGEALVVSQFTLVADTQQGNRPSFSAGAPPTLALPLYQAFIHALKQQGVEVRSGEFAADMQVSLTNDGPVTFSFAT